MSFVNIKGKIQYGEKEVSTLLQYKVKGEDIELNALEFNEIPQNIAMYNTLFTSMCEATGQGETTTPSPAKPNKEEPKLLFEGKFASAFRQGIVHVSGDASPIGSFFDSQENVTWKKINETQWVVTWAKKDPMRSQENTMLFLFEKVGSGKEKGIILHRVVNNEIELSRGEVQDIADTLLRNGTILRDAQKQSKK